MRKKSSLVLAALLGGIAVQAVLVACSNPTVVAGMEDMLGIDMSKIADLSGVKDASAQDMAGACSCDPSKFVAIGTALQSGDFHLSGTGHTDGNFTAAYVSAAKGVEVGPGFALKNVPGATTPATCQATCAAANKNANSIGFCLAAFSAGHVPTDCTTSSANLDCVCMVNL